MTARIRPRRKDRAPAAGDASQGDLRREAVNRRLAGLVAEIAALKPFDPKTSLMTEIDILEVATKLTTATDT